MLSITQKDLEGFQRYLRLREKSRATIEKYLHDVNILRAFAGELIVDKETLIRFKERLGEQGYAASSINSMLAAVNQYLRFMGCEEWRMRFLKIQRATFIHREKVLSRIEYQRMVEQAERMGNRRLSLLMQTICVTGIRVSEVKSITVEALRKGEACICLKGKLRQILLPRELCRRLLDYSRQNHIRRGPVFITRTGRPMDRSLIWKMLKRLGRQAKIKAQKVYPHNLRHLFAATYYKKYKDVVRLADILGHNSINTTRIYTMRDGSEQKRQMGSLRLLI